MEVSRTVNHQIPAKSKILVLENPQRRGGVVGQLFLDSLILGGNVFGESRSARSDERLGNDQVQMRLILLNEALNDYRRDERRNEKMKTQKRKTKDRLT